LATRLVAISHARLILSVYSEARERCPSTNYKFFLMDEQTDTLKTLCLGMCGIDFYSRVSTLTPDIDIVTMAD